MDYPTLKQKAIELAAEFRATKVLMEDATTATGLLQELNYTVIGLTGIKPDRDKISRMAMRLVSSKRGKSSFRIKRLGWLNWRLSCLRFQARDLTIRSTASVRP